jgi:RHS repeat-associated protein
MGTSSSGSYTLPANSITSEGLHTITIKAIDKAGNFVESTPQYYSVDDSLVLDSNTYIGTATLTNYYGKNLIHWNPPATIPSQVYYKVYRGTTPNFTMDSSTLLAADLKTSYYIDMNIGGTGTYYYKVKVVKKNIYGQEVAYDAVSSEMIGTQKTASEFGAGIGQNFYMDYFTFGTPSGNGYVERRYGNLGYSQQDFTLSNMEFDYGLTRTYNSQSANTGMLGKGWSDSYHQEIYKNSDGKYYFRQGDGTTYTFALVSGSTYKCEQTKEYSLTVNAVPNQGVMYVISTKDNTVYDFNVYGQLIKASKPTGVGLNYEYDSYGRLANVISINGLSQSEKSISMTYSQTSPYTLSKIVLPDSSERLYSVSPTGQLDGVTFSRGGFTGGGTTESVVYNYGYDTNGLLNQIKDGELNSYSIEYTDGKASKVTYPNSEYFQIGYTVDGNQNTINTITKKYGSSEFYSEQAILDADTGKILARTGASGLLTEYTYLTGQTENHLLLEKTTAQKSYETLDLGSGNIGFATMPTVEINDIVYNSDENVIEESVSQVTGQTTTTATTSYEYNDEPNQNSNLISAVTEETTITKSGSSATTVETVSEYAYDEEGRIISETTDPEPETIIFEDKDGYSATQYDYAFNTVAGPYTATESVFVEGETVASQISTTTLDAEGNPTASTSEAGAAENLSTSVCDEMGRVTLEEEKDPDNTSNIIRTTTHAYDYLGREISVTSAQDGLTTTTTNSYNKNNSLVSTTDDLGITSTYTFDSLNRETGKTTTGGSLSGGSATTSYGYESTISLPDQLSLSTIAIVYKEATTENGQTRTKWTDGNGNLIKEESGGVTRYFKYDQSGNQVLEFIQGDANNAARAFMTLYDQKGNVFANIQNPEISTGNPATYSISAESILTRTLYYDNGKVKAQIDGKGVITHFTYDTMGRVVGITEDAVLDGNGDLISGAIQNSISYPDQFTTSASNGEGTLNIKIVDAAGLTTQVITSDEDDTNVKIGTTFNYDQQGRLTKETYQDNTFKTYEYNSKGQLVSISTYIPNTQVPEEPIEQTRAEYTYNSDNQKTGEIDYKLNAQGAMTAHHYEYFEHDSLGRVSGVIALNQEAAPTPAAKESHKTSYSYNSAGQVTDITYPLNTADEVKGLEYVYDGVGRITEVNAKLGTETKPLRTYGYDCFGEVSEITDMADFTGAGVNTIERTYIYDNFGRVSSMQYVNGNTTLESFALTYDDNSNITSEVDGSVTKSYSYDDLGRLTTVLTGSAATDYTYDNAGNRTTKTTGDRQTSYSYNDLNQMITSTEKTKDQDGDYTQLEASSAYTYDSKGNLTQDSETRGSVNTVMDNTYTVDSMLAGVSIQGGAQDGFAQENTYNGNGQRIKKDEDGNLTNYFYQGSSVLYTTDSLDTKTSQNMLSPVGSVIDTARYAPTDISYYLYNKDIRNSTASIVDENAGFATKYSYDEFGITTVDGSYTFANEICYTGGIYDLNSGQYYLNSRYYDPQQGRFLSEDTYRGEMNNPNSWYLYSYCANNPINYTDPSGHWVISAGLEAGAACGLGAYIMLGANIDGTYLSVTFSAGLLVISNVAAYIGGFIAYYPHKDIFDLNGVGLSVGASIAVGVRLSAGGSGEFSSTGNGFSVGGGVGVGIPIPYWEVKFGYTWTVVKWKLSSIPSGTKRPKWYMGSYISVTKYSTYSSIYIGPMKKTLRMYYNKKVTVS